MVVAVAGVVVDKGSYLVDYMCAGCVDVASASAHIRHPVNNIGEQLVDVGKGLGLLRGSGKTVEDHDGGRDDERKEDDGQYDLGSAGDLLGRRAALGASTASAARPDEEDDRRQDADDDDGDGAVADVLNVRQVRLEGCCG